MAHDQPVAALVVAVTDNLAPAVYSINRLCPESLCFVLPDSAKSLVETEVQPKISQIPRRWDWIVLSDSDHFPSCYQSIARSLPGLLRTWGIEPGSLVVDLTGATPAMAGALALVTMPLTSRIVSIAASKEGREGEAVTFEGREGLWLWPIPGMKRPRSCGETDVICSIEARMWPPDRSSARLKRA